VSVRPHIVSALCQEHFKLYVVLFGEVIRKWNWTL